MTTSKRVFALGGCMLLGAASVVQADATQGSGVAAELSALRTRIAQLEGQQNQSWLNERRAEEVKALVREVLADADTRASMQEGGITAGYNNGFFIASEDGKFLLKVGGQIQTRYTANFREGSLNSFGTHEDTWVHGFSLPRTKLFFDGHVGSPKIGYHMVLSTSSASGVDSSTLEVEEAWVDAEVADNVTVFAGRRSLAYDRLNEVSTRYTTALERYSNGSGDLAAGNPVNAGVTVNFNDSARLTAQLFNSYSTASTIEYGLSARAEFKLAGSWDQYTDMNAWSDEGLLQVIGVGAQYAQGREGTNTTIDESRPFSITADYQLENNGLSVLVAGNLGTNFDNNSYWHNYMLLAQVGYFIVPDQVEVYGRGEYYNIKGGNGDFFTAAAGVNYYLDRHNAKFTFEVNYSKWDNPGGPGWIGQDVGDRNQLFASAQFQLLF